MNRLTIVLISLLSLLGLRAQNDTPGQWRLHNTWDYYPVKVVDTKDRAYYLMLGQYRNNDVVGWSEESGQLFVLDKETNEMQGYNAANYLHGNVIQNIAYNAKKGYLLIIYNDYNIDLLYDDDTVYTVPGLSTAVLTSSKTVNNITFDAENDKAYLATAFGYLVIDDNKHVIAESRVYNVPLTGLGRVGDRLVASTSTGLYQSPVDVRHSTWDTFTPVAGVTGAVDAIIPLNDNQFAFSQSGGHVATFDSEGAVSTTKLFSDKIHYFSENKDGYFMLNDWQGNQLKRDGTNKRFSHPVELRGRKAGSWDGETIYYEAARSGIDVRKYNSSDNTWSQVLKQPNNFMQPYKIFHIQHSPTYGMIVANESFNRFLSPYWVNIRHLMSYYKDGVCTNFGSAVNPMTINTDQKNGYGPVIDPIDGNVLWSGSYNGLFKMTLPDNTFAIYTHANATGKGQPGFHAVFPVIFDGSANKVQIGVPSFDNDGTMWVAQNIESKAANNYNPIYYWSAADRKADNTAGFKSMAVKNYQKFGDVAHVVALKHSSNRNIILLYHPTHWGGGFYAINHQGTLDNSNDDVVVHLSSFTDQNGNGIPSVFVNHLYEDPATGTVWVATSTGMFTFKPTELLSGKTTVTRIIVSRNDGTNQGDYLLAGNDVLHINSDGAGRKWFSTNGNGLVVTSANGDEIEEHFTAENSLLPSNQVYCTGFDPTSNAVWIGTQYQLATYYSDVTPGSADYSNVISYPNPVRPDFYGQVTIQGLMDNSLVKILDQGGHLVKELGRSEGGMIMWDLTNVQGNRVSTGVYFIAASTDESGSANVGKILVVR